jgi:hypothetical protein
MVSESVGAKDRKQLLIAVVGHGYAGRGPYPYEPLVCSWMGFPVWCSGACDGFNVAAHAPLQ